MADTHEGPFSLVQMFWGNLAARPLRGFLTILAIAIQVVERFLQLLSGKGG